MTCESVSRLLGPEMGGSLEDIFVILTYQISPVHTDSCYKARGKAGVQENTKLIHIPSQYK